MLAERGRRDADALREVLQARGLVPDAVIVSTAARARETWEHADPGGPPVEFDERVYEASTADLRAVIAEVEGEVVALVGHNPGFERLAWELDNSPQLARGLPTCAVAIFDVADWTLASATLRELILP